MIVRYNNIDYLVLALYMYEYHNRCSECYDSWVSCVSIDGFDVYHINLHDALVVDGRFQDGLCLNRLTSHDGSYSLVRITGNVIACYAGNCIGSDVDDDFYLDDFRTDVALNNYKASKVFYGYINSIREFHGLSKYDLSFIESYKTEDDEEIPTEEELRAKALNDELEEYLRIGEELEKQKDMKK